MIIKELSILSEAQVKDILSFMGELTKKIVVTPEMLMQSVASDNSYFFAIINDNDHIIGCATLCVFDTPTGKKASVEDVVVSSQYRGHGLGRLLMQHVIEYAKTEFHNIDIHLTSSPHRVAANKLYQVLGFQKRETNVYLVNIRNGCIQF